MKLPSQKCRMTCNTRILFTLVNLLREVEVDDNIDGILYVIPPSLASSYTYNLDPPMQWRTQEKISGGGVQGRGSGLVGGPGAAKPPGRRRIFENLQKIPEENGKKCCIFAYFAKKFQNHAVNFCAFGRKTQLFGKF